MKHDMNIDLGYELSHPEPHMASQVNTKEKMYPSFTYEGEEALDLPDDGIMVVEFHTRRESTTTEEDGDKQYSCTVEVRKIKHVEPLKDEQPTKPYKDAEEALDKLARA